MPLSVTKAILPAALAGLFALAPCRGDAAPPAVLTITVEHVSPQGGDLRVALYDKDSYGLANGDPVTDAVVPAKSPETVITLAAVKPGIYAVKMFQDVNRNGQFDMNWIGYPLERYGFSNDVRPGFSEPPFDATKFELHPGANAITIHLQ